jgi:pSer/pThr/pTyr-binding forkhead associated (FHA) protein
MVNGQPATQQLIQDGDRISLGRIRLLFKSRKEQA